LYVEKTPPAGTRFQGGGPNALDARPGGPPGRRLFHQQGEPVKLGWQWDIDEILGAGWFAPGFRGSIFARSWPGRSAPDRENLLGEIYAIFGAASEPRIFDALSAAQLGPGSQLLNIKNRRRRREDGGFPALLFGREFHRPEREWTAAIGVFL